MKTRPIPAYRKTLLVAGILYSLVFLLSCLTSYIPPSASFFFTYAGLFFPFLLIGFLAWLLIVIFLFRKYFIFFLLLLIPAWKNTSAILAVHAGKRFTYKKKPNSLRILSWNVNNFIYGSFTEPAFLEIQGEMLNFIKTSGADVLCFQDYSEVPGFFGKANIAYICDSLGYPYHYFSDDCNSYGTVIFSRMPIIDSGHIKYPPNEGEPESLAFVSIPFQKDTLRIYNTHLRSMYLHKDALSADKIGYIELVKKDTSFLFHSNRFSRLEYFDKQHQRQADLIKGELDKTTTPYILCADLNSVPSSYVYQKISKGMNDAFLQGGAGFGGTYHSYTLTLRIDVVLTSKQLTAEQYFSPRLDLSDHYPILTDIKLAR